MLRDPEKLANARETYYYRNRKQLLKAAADRYKANRQDRLDYQTHYRQAQKTLAGVKNPPTHPQGVTPALRLRVAKPVDG